MVINTCHVIVNEDIIQGMVCKIILNLLVDFPVGTHSHLFTQSIDLVDEYLKQSIFGSIYRKSTQTSNLMSLLI